MTIQQTTTFDLQFEHAEQSGSTDYQHALPLYFRRLKRLIFVGDVVLWGLLTIFVCLVVGLFILVVGATGIFLFLLKTTLILIPLLLIWLIVISLAHRIDKIQGYHLKRSEHPKLWKLINYQSDRLNIKPPHSIVLTHHMQLRCHGTSLLSFFPPYRYSLEVGLPLLSVISDQQFKALVVSELARYSTLSNHLFPRVLGRRQLWLHLYQNVMLSNRWGIGFFRRFCDVYVPKLLGYSLPLNQEGIKLADTIASDKFTANALSLALLRTNVYAEWLERYFWKQVWQKSDHLKDPPADVFSSLYQRLLKDEHISRSELKESRYDVFYTNNRYESLLNLAQRLDYIGGEISLLKYDDAVSEIYLGQHLSNILRYFDKQWKASSSEQWTQKYNDFQIGLQQVRLLSQKEKLPFYNADEWWKLVQLIDRYLPDKTGGIFYRLYYRSFPQDKRASYILGKYLLNNQQVEGVSLLKKSYQLLLLAYESAGLLSAYYDKLNDPEAASYWKIKANNARQQKELATKRLYSLSAKDNLVAPDRDRIAKQKIKLLGCLDQHPLVREVWIAEKQLTAPAYGTLYVMGVMTKGGWWRSANSLERELVNMTGTRYNLCLVTDRSSRRMIKRIKQVGLNIYS